MAIRSRLARPGLTAAVVASLTLGIGVNAAMFSVAKAVLVEPLVFDDPDGIFMVWERNFPRERPRNVASPRNFVAWREASSSFATMVALIQRRLTFAGGEVPAMLPAVQVTEGLFDVLGAPPMQGRVFRSEDHASGAPAVAVITDAMWRGPLAGDPEVLGRSLVLEDVPYTIVGVLPPSYRFELPGTTYSFPIEPMVFLPVDIPARWREQRGRSLAVVARARDGVGLEAAQAEMSRIAETLVERYPDSNTGWGVSVVPLKEQIVGDVRPVLLLLWAAVSATLAIVAANVMSLLLGRALARRREMAIRTAIGAGSGHIVRQLLVESLVLTLVSAGVGLALAESALRILTKGNLIDVPRIDAVAIDSGVLLYTLAVSAVLSILFGLVPALESMRSDVQTALREESHASSAGAGRSRLRAALVVTEVALAVILLAGAGLLLRTLAALGRVDTGFARDGAATLTVGLPDRYDTDVARAQFFDALVSRTEALAEVDAAAVVSALPLTGPHAATSFWAGDGPAPARGEAPTADIRVIRGNYFRALSIPLLAGRLFDARDGDAAPPRAIVSGAAVAGLWPGAEPFEVLGREVVISWGEPLQAQIVGVVGDVRHHGIDVAPRAMIYWPHAQNPWSDMTLVARTTSTTATPQRLLPALFEELEALDPAVAAFDISTLSDVLDTSLEDQRLSSFVLALFAALAIGLASLGVYGVVSLAAFARSREMSLRLALGATPRRVIRLVLTEGLLPVGSGIAVGLVGAVGATRLLSSMLYDVTPTDPVSYGAAAALLLAIATLAAYLPARRTSRLDPATVLRSE